MGRVVAIAVSVIAGVAAGAVADVLTDGWDWPLGIALAVLVVALIGSQWWLSKLDATRRPKVIAAGAGAVAAGESIKADIESDIKGNPPPGPVTADHDVAATGIASVAVGRKFRGSIRSKYSSR